MIKTQVKKNEFPKIAAGLATGFSAVVQSTAKAVSAGAKQRARVGATGDMQRGFYTRHDGPFSSHVSNSTFYWRFHEYGTHKMAAHPMVTPAVEHERVQYFAALAAVIRSGPSVI